MAHLEMKVPSPGESISEVEIAAWLVADGDYVEKDQAVAEVDSDKATLELPAEESGIITLKAAEGDVVKVGQVVCLIDTSAAKPAGFSSSKSKEDENPSEPNSKEKTTESSEIQKEKTYASGLPSPAAAKIIAEKSLSNEHLIGSGKDGRITKQDVLQVLESGKSSSSGALNGGARGTRREKM